MPGPLNIKIHTALIIAVAFIFRLLFVNISSITSIGNANTKQLISTHFSSKLKKRKRSNEVIVSTIAEKASVVEVFEEDRDQEELESKINHPVLFSFLFSWFKQITITSDLKQVFDRYSSQIHSKYFLSLSILRI